MSEFAIPLGRGAQTFTIGLGDVPVRMSLTYRDADGGGWVLDIERSDGSDAIYGIPLVLGVDLLAQHAHKRLGHLRCVLDGNAERVPTFDDVGSGLTLIWSQP